MCNQRLISVSKYLRIFFDLFKTILAVFFRTQAKPARNHSASDHLFSNPKIFVNQISSSGNKIVWLLCQRIVKLGQNVFLMINLSVFYPNKFLIKFSEQQYAITKTKLDRISGGYSLDFEMSPVGKPLNIFPKREKCLSNFCSWYSARCWWLLCLPTN